MKAAYGFVAMVVGMENHTLYPDHFGPSIHSPLVIWLMLWIIIALELLAGILAAKGAFYLWKARSARALEFHAAKKFAILGCSIAILIWFGIFSAVGGIYFQMGQTQAGATALGGAFQYAVLNGLVLLIINSADS